MGCCLFLNTRSYKFLLPFFLSFFYIGGFWFLILLLVAESEMVEGLKSGESPNQRLSAEALRVEEDSKSVGFWRL